MPSREVKQHVKQPIKVTVKMVILMASEEVLHPFYPTKAPSTFLTMLNFDDNFQGHRHSVNAIAGGHPMEWPFKAGSTALAYTTILFSPILKWRNSDKSDERCRF